MFVHELFFIHVTGTKMDNDDNEQELKLDGCSEATESYLQLVATCRHHTSTLWGRFAGSAYNMYTAVNRYVTVMTCIFF